MSDMSTKTINSSKPISCMVVDDDINTTDVFAEYLELKKMNVIGKAYDAETAVKMFEQKRPYIVFLDVMMEPKDGCYALENIKKLDPTAIVIMVTADLTKETEEKLEKLNASAIIYKPFKIEDIMNIVTSFTEHKLEVPICPS